MSNKKSKPFGSSSEKPDHIMLSISDDPRYTATVSWRNSADVKMGYMEFEPIEGGEKIRVNPIMKTIKSDLGESNFFYAKATGLMPGKKYKYTVGSDLNRSKTFTFQTQEENLTKFKFLIIGDHQNSTPHMAPEYAPVRRLLKKVLAEHPDIRFIFTVGDNCDNGENEIQWNGMFYGLRDIIESIPYMMSTGNHDNRGYEDYENDIGKYYLEHADYFDAQFEYSYPQNGPEGYKTENYSFEYGNVHITSLGINEPELVNEWCYKDLQKSDKTWKFGNYHFPIYPVMPEGQNYDSYPMMRQCVEEGRFDILFSGHEHSLARSFPIKNDEMFDKPSQGTINYIAGHSGANPYVSNAQKIWHNYFHPQEEPLAMCSIVEIDDNKLTITAKLEDDRIADVFKIDKDTDTIYPHALAPIYLKTKMAYKGDMIEIGARGCHPEFIDNMWFAPLACLFSFISSDVIRTKGQLKIISYDKKAVFTEGSDIMETSEENIKLSAKVYRANNGQLYIPLDKSLEYFGIEWTFVKRNNIIYFDTPNEILLITKHP